MVRGETHDHREQRCRLQARNGAHRLVCGLVLFVLLLLLGSVASAESNPATKAADALVGELKASRGGIEGLGVAAELTGLLPWLDIEARRSVLDAANRTRPHPEAMDLLRRERALLALDTGNRELADKHTAQGGYLTAWWLAGPLSRKQLGDVPPPTEVDTTAPVNGKLGPTTWRDISGRDHLGSIDVETLVRPTDSAVVWAATTVSLPRKARVVMRVGSTTPYVLRVDGVEIGREEVDVDGLYGRDTWGVELDRGDHLVTLELDNYEGVAQFSARITDERGRVISGLTAQAPGGKAATAPKTFQVVTPLEAYLKWARGLPTNAQKGRKARALARGALLARHYRPEDHERPPRQLVAEALAVDADNLETLRIAAEVYPAHWRRKQAIDRALANAGKDQNKAWLTFLWVQITAESVGDAHYVETLAMLDELERAHPEFVGVAVLRSQLLLREGRPHMALAAVDEALDKHAGHPKLVTAGLSAASELPLPDRQLTFYETLTKTSASSLAIYAPLVDLLVKVGRDKDAVALAEKASGLRPDVTGFYLLEADVHRALGDKTRSLKKLEALAELVPGDAQYWTRVGTAKAEMGDKEGAVAALDRAIALEPQNVEVRRYRDFLEPAADGVDETFAMTAGALSEEVEDERFRAEDYYYLVDQKVVQVYRNGLASTFVQKVIKIRTDVGVSAMRQFAIPYTPGDEEVDIRRVTLTGKDGKVRQGYTTFEQSMSEPWYNLHYDYRAMVLNFPDLARGDTLEIRYKVSQTASTNIFGDYFGDMWFFQDTVPKLAARYVLLTPTERTFVIRAPKLPHEPETREVETPSGVFTARMWTLKNVPGIADEPQMPGFSEVADYIHISTYRSWSEMAKWYWNLIEDQLVVDADIRKAVKTATDGVTDKRAKVSALADYVLKNTRYVGLEFGIHGYKPYRTTVCFTRRFGDCKDKASLLKVMLEEAGIPANIVLVRTRRNGAIDDTPASLRMFDHAITYVPEFDLFIDGTAEYSGTRELPWQDQGVQVLIVEDGGGHKFTRTPIEPADKNKTTLRFDVDLRSNKATVSTKITGADASGLRRAFGTEESRREIFEKELTNSFAGAKLDKLSFSDLTRLEEPVQIDYTFVDPRFTDKTGKTLTFLPTLRQRRLIDRFAPRTEREHDQLVGPPSVTIETYKIRLPDNYELTAVPKPVDLRSPFGRFALTIAENGRLVTVEMTMRLDEHRVAAADYAKYRKWIESIEETLKQRLEAKR